MESDRLCGWLRWQVEEVNGYFEQVLDEFLQAAKQDREDAYVKPADDAGETTGGLWAAEGEDRVEAGARERAEECWRGSEGESEVLSCFFLAC